MTVWVEEVNQSTDTFIDTFTNDFSIWAKESENDSDVYVDLYGDTYGSLWRKELDGSTTWTEV